MKHDVGRDVRGVAVPFGVGNLPVQSFIGRVVVNIRQPLTSMEPKLVWGSTSVQNSVNVHLEPADALGFNRVLVLAMWFRKFITNIVRLMQFHHGGTLLGFGVVSVKNTGHTFIPKEIPVNIMGISFFLHATDVCHMGCHAMANLGTGVAFHTWNVGKHGVGRDLLIDALISQPLEAGPEVSDHGKLGDSSGQLGCALESFSYPMDRNMAKFWMKGGQIINLWQGSGKLMADLILLQRFWINHGRWNVRVCDLRDSW